ncbi:uncharacterized protein BXZ73DRAFT_77429 [Epithele typhae]|uniref:uncharacterized protein n=1 Tax=Epithele typhae TaxID=378194 RepID=UPI002007FEBE|nr:uncharacterized protein BXZ73DRAFT_77429 [Epithele typhae]KAH9932715.1 hypothetical protein BXZ73DRAFT_77429 [Epithele typhae]
MASTSTATLVSFTKGTTSTTQGSSSQTTIKTVATSTGGPGLHYLGQATEHNPLTLPSHAAVTDHSSIVPTFPAPASGPDPSPGPHLSPLDAPVTRSKSKLAALREHAPGRMPPSGQPSSPDAITGAHGSTWPARQAVRLRPSSRPLASAVVRPLPGCLRLRHAIAAKLRLGFEVRRLHRAAADDQDQTADTVPAAVRGAYALVHE